MIWSSVKIFLMFVLGFLSSKAFDMFFEIEDLIKVLDNGGITLANEKKVQVRSVAATSLPSTEDVTNTISGAAPPAMGDAYLPVDRPVLSSSAESGFASIVKTAYDRALNPKLRERPQFDVDWWETKSGLNTTGGLTHLDRQMLGRIYRNASSVFEFGLGESTYIANHVGVPRYGGIDSDPVWVGMAREKVAPYFRFYLGDVGKTLAWGWPAQRAGQKNILNYQLSPLIVEPLPFDVYMVDGRWRLPIMIACFLHASDRGAPPSDTIVLLHDCGRTHTSGRLGYKRADHLLNLVQHSGGHLCVYKRKPDTTDDQLTEFWHKMKDEMER